ncbi:hypothetical protein [Microbacterium gorillae]|uniref:hypothetical protein n=1 Tax=Microbacterium gorillae TaxID=1231063 RepID=UPI0006950633|nr:hypothetical protein [Microbacterium gorillae]
MARRRLITAWAGGATVVLASVFALTPAVHAETAPSEDAPANVVVSLAWEKPESATAVPAPTYTVDYEYDGPSCSDDGTPLTGGGSFEVTVGGETTLVGVPGGVNLTLSARPLDGYLAPGIAAGWPWFAENGTASSCGGSETRYHGYTSLSFSSGHATWQAVSPDGKLLPGAVWELVGPESRFVIDGPPQNPDAPNEPGWGYAGYGEWGEFILTELTPPPGYSGVAPITFVVDGTHLVHELGPIVHQPLVTEPTPTPTATPEPTTTTDPSPTATASPTSTAVPSPTSVPTRSATAPPTRPASASPTRTGLASTGASGAESAAAVVVGLLVAGIGTAVIARTRTRATPRRD